MLLCISSVYSPFSDRVGLSLHNTPFPGVLMKSIGAAFFYRMPYLTSTTYTHSHVVSFVVVISMCWLYVSLGSRISPSILGLMFMGSLMLSICSSSGVLYSSGSGVKIVHVVLSVLSMYVFPVGMIGYLLLLC